MQILLLLPVKGETQPSAPKVLVLSNEKSP